MLFLNLSEHSNSSKCHRTFFFCACSFSEALEGLRLNIFTVSGRKISPGPKTARMLHTGLGQRRFLSQSELSALKKTHMLRGRHSCTPLQHKPRRRKLRCFTETKMVQRQTNEVCVCLPEKNIQFCVVGLLLTRTKNAVVVFRADVRKCVDWDDNQRKFSGFLILFQFHINDVCPPPSVDFV